MEQEQILSSVQQAIVTEMEDLSTSDIVLTAKLEEDLGVDSLSLMTIVAQLENDLKVEVADEAISRFKTVEDLVLYLQEILNPASH